jgi:hypothetical protein
VAYPVCQRVTTGDRRVAGALVTMLSSARRYRSFAQAPLRRPIGLRVL